MAAVPGLLGGWRVADLRQAVRAAVGTAAAYAAYRLLGLEQGYWAVFTVIIVVGGSIGSTLGAATDRMLGTVTGALLGGIAAALIPPLDAGRGIALAVVVLVTSAVAARWPRFRTAPVTAAIMLLSQGPGAGSPGFVLDRVLAIGLGGIIGVAASLLVFPARSDRLVIARAAGVLGQIATQLRAYAEALDAPGSAPVAADHAALRAALVGVEQAMTDANRERASRLAPHRLPPAIPRTLWRIRNDLVLIARALDIGLPATLVDAVGPAASALLRAEAGFADDCAAALRAGRTAGDRPIAEMAAVESAMDDLRHTDEAHALRFEEAGRVFGLAFTLEQLHRDLGDVAQRIAEIVDAPADALAA